MRSCPTCNRTYEDDSLSFCLEDGARLTGTYYVPPTVAASHLHDADPGKTAILPPHRRPTDEASQPQATIAAVTSGSYRQSTTPNEVAQKPPTSLWIVLGGAVALVVVGLIIVFGYLAFKPNDDRLTTQSSATSPNVQPNSSVDTNGNVGTNGNVKTLVTLQPNSNVQSNANVPANSNIQPNSNIAANANQVSEPSPPSADANLNWLEGMWIGEGYQSDTRTTWTVRLTVRDGTFAIEYPNIPCRGTWSLTSKHSRGASFTEYITQGSDRCAQNERVIIEKVSDSEISCKFSHAGSRNVIATAVLTKR